MEQMDGLNAEIINVMTSISMLEDEITQKEKDIEVTQEEYEKAIFARTELKGDGWQYCNIPL